MRRAIPAGLPVDPTSTSPVQPGYAPARNGLRRPTVVLSLLYGVILMFGLATLPAQDPPIADPWLTLMEGLILFVAPAKAALMVALRAWSSFGRQMSG